MEQRGNKTVMCSVLFLDIEEYSKKPVSGQIALKDRFNAFLADAIRNVPLNDRIILDTGDGAAISFLGDVEDALKVALCMREHLLNDSLDMEIPLLMRMGINLGPVRLVKDINGQPNIVGDGINVAQRVMGFADSGQILVSRSYYDAVSRLSLEYTEMFHYQGERTDKHVRAHEVYAIGYPGDLSTKHGEAVDENTGKTIIAGPEASGWMATLHRSYQQQRAIYIGLAVGALVLLVAELIEVARRPAQISQSVEAPVPTEEHVVSAVAPAPKLAEPTVQKEKSKTATSVQAATKTVHSTQETPKTAHSAQEASKPTPPAPAASKPAVAQEKTTVPISRVRTLEETTSVDPSVAAKVSIAVTPWGNVYLDGRMQGVSPPLEELQVAPGKHDIELRNTTFPAYSQTIEVKAGEQIKIKHKFR